MKTVILYNIISLIIIFVLIFVLRIVSKSDLRKNQQLIIKVITTILIVIRIIKDIKLIFQSLIAGNQKGISSLESNLSFCVI